MCVRRLAVGSADLFRLRSQTSLRSVCSSLRSEFDCAQDDADEKVPSEARQDLQRSNAHCALSHYNINLRSFAFSFDTRGAKEKASQKEKRRFFGGSAPLDPVRFLKKAKPKTFLDRSLQDVHSARWLWTSYVCALIGCRLSRLQKSNSLLITLQLSPSTARHYTPYKEALHFRFHRGTE